MYPPGDATSRQLAQKCRSLKQRPYSKTLKIPHTLSTMRFSLYALLRPKSSIPTVLGYSQDARSPHY
eukprot:6157102-Pyramimonas_sp.AAC.1